jgi:hypothetical protein
VPESPPTAPERPRETLHRGVQVVLRELGVAGAVNASGWLRHSGRWVEWGGPLRFDAFGGDAAGHVVDASGRRHWSARRLGFPVHRVSRRLIASWGQLTGRWPDRDDAPLLQPDATGWTEGGRRPAPTGLSPRRAGAPAGARPA